MRRAPVLRRAAGPPGVLHTPAEPLAALPRIRGRGVLDTGTTGASRATAEDLPASPSRRCYGERGGIETRGTHGTGQGGRNV